MTDMTPYREVLPGSTYRFDGARLRKLKEGETSDNNAFNCLTLKYVHVDISPDTLVEIIEPPSRKTPPPPL